MDNYEDGGGRVSVGQVFSRAFGVIADNPLTVLGVVFLLGTLPSLALQWFQLSWRNAQLDGTQQVGAFAVGLISMIIALALYAIVQGALVRATMAYSTGDRATLGECIRAGMSVILPLLGVAILSALGMGLGMAFFLVPGVILLVMWSVAAPALVAERCGVFEAFSRSRELTRGSRWKIFGLLMVVVVAYLIIISLFSSLVFASAGTALATLAQGDSVPVSWLLGNAVLSLITTTWWGTTMTSLYVELRNAKEGGTEQALSEIFA